MNIVLLGFMCSGKSRVGSILSERLGWPHYDTDELVESQAGCTVADLIRNHGEGFFRDIEKQVVKDLASHDQAIISTGGGVPLIRANMDYLKRKSASFWLRVSPKVVLERAGDISTRPLIDPDRPFDSICDLMKQRRDFYSVAEFHINTDHLTAEEVADQVLAKLPELKR